MSNPTNSEREVERKFLVGPGDLPVDINSMSVRGLRLKQGYVALAADGSEARIRSIDGRVFEFTVKSAGTLVRGESTISITGEMFDSLWTKTDGAQIEKLRLQIPDGKHTIELDVYQGALAGLVVAEVEFKGDAAHGLTPEDQAATYVGPTWFSLDVTADSAYKNKNLAVKGVPPDALARF